MILSYAILTAFLLTHAYDCETKNMRINIMNTVVTLFL